MSAVGQKQTYAVQKVMSALPLKADMCSALAHIRFGPKADIRVGYDRFGINAAARQNHRDFGELA